MRAVGQSDHRPGLVTGISSGGISIEPDCWFLRYRRESPTHFAFVKGSSIGKYVLRLVGRALKARTLVRAQAGELSPPICHNLSWRRHEWRPGHHEPRKRNPLHTRAAAPVDNLPKDSRR